VAEAKTPHPDTIKPVHIGGESFIDRIAPHLKQIMIALGVIVFVFTVIFTIRWIGERGRAKETAKLAEAVAVANRPVLAAGAEAEAGEQTFATSKERATKVLEALNKHPSEMTSDVYQAAMAYGAEQYDTAITSYRKAIGAPGLEGALAREGLTLALEAKAAADKDAGAKQKGLEEALAAARAIQPDADGPRRIYGLYHEARLLVLLGKGSEAKALFEKVKTMAEKAPDDKAKVIEGADLRSLAESRIADLGATP
jgi:tetratricopeptide (TPR) repeat protein